MTELREVDGYAIYDSDEDGERVYLVFTGGYEPYCAGVYRALESTVLAAKKYSRRGTWIDEEILRD